MLQLQSEAIASASGLLGQPFPGEDPQRLSNILSRLLRPEKRDLTTITGTASLIHHGRLIIGGEELPQTLAEFETDQGNKMNPRSYYSPADLESLVNGLTTNREVHVANVRGLWDATRQVRDSLNLEPIQISRLSALGSLLSKETTTAAGSPFFVKRSTICYPYLSKDWRKSNLAREEEARRAWEIGGSVDILSLPVRAFPYILNYRVEASADPTQTKHRVVWSAPILSQIEEERFAATTVAQLQFSRDVSDNISEQDAFHGAIFPYQMPEYLHSYLMGMKKSAEEWGTSLYSIDYSSFDQHVAIELIQMAFYALRVKDDNVVNRFTYKELHTPWGREKFSGRVPSGSVFTNLIDSTVNAIVLTWMFAQLDRTGIIRVNGDDGVFVVDRDISSEEISAMASEVGMVMNPEKQWIAKDGFLFCKAYWGPEFNGPVYSLNKMANAIARLDQDVYKVIMTGDMEVIRNFQFLDMLMTHPYRERFLSRLLPAFDDGGWLLDTARIETGLRELSEYSGARAWSSVELTKRCDSILARYGFEGDLDGRATDTEEGIISKEKSSDDDAHSEPDVL